MVERRYQLESDEDTPIEEREHLRIELMEWANGVGMMEAASHIEKADLLEVPIGRLDHQAELNAFWRMESAGIMMWALGAYPNDIPYDRDFRGGAEIGLPSGNQEAAITSFVAEAQLRPANEIDRQRMIAELWNWRSRNEELIRGVRKLNSTHTSSPILKHSKKEAYAAHARGYLPPLIDGDFAALDKAYAALTLEEVQCLQSVAMERHYALNWISGYSKNWDKVPTDTCGDASNAHRRRSRRSTHDPLARFEGYPPLERTTVRS